MGMIQRHQFAHVDPGDRAPLTGFPHGRENLEKWQSIFQLGNFEHVRKVMKFCTNY